MKTKFTTSDFDLIKLLYNSYKKYNGIAEVIVRDIAEYNKNGPSEKIYTNPTLDQLFELHSEYGLLTLNYNPEISAEPQ